MQQRLLLIAGFLLTGAARALHPAFDYSWRAPLTPSDWQAEPSWQPDPAARARCVQSGDSLLFEVPEAGRGMKWSQSLRPVLFADMPYLVFTYRAENAVTDSDNYLLYVDDQKPGETRALLLRHLRADGDWHTLAVDLRKVSSGERVRKLAIQVRARQGGNARLWVREVRLSERVPAGAENVDEEARGESRPDWWADVENARFEPQPSWLGNPGENCTAQVQEGTVRLSVPQAGRGMKWNWLFAEEVPLAGHSFIALRYRATGMAPRADYAVCVLGSDDRQGRDYEPVIMPGQLRHDGRWHTTSIPLGAIPNRFPAILGVAVQVQAQRTDAVLEIARLGLVHSPQPQPADDFIPPAAARFRPGDTPLRVEADGDVRLADFLEALGVANRGPRTAISVSEAVFEVPGGGAPVLASGIVAQGPLHIPVRRPATAIHLLLGVILRGAEEEVYSRSARLTRIAEIDRFEIRIRYADGTVENAFPFNLSTRRYEITEGIHALQVRVDPRRTVDRLTVLDKTPGGAFVVLAVTLRSGTDPFPEPDDELLSLARRPRPDRSPPLPPAIRREGNLLQVENGPLQAGFELIPAPRLAGLVDRHTGRNLLSPGAEPHLLYELTVEGEPVRPEEWTLTDCEVRNAAATLRYRVGKQPVKVVITVALGETGEMRLGATLENGGTTGIGVALTGPRTGPVALGEDPEDDIYFFPAQGTRLGTRDVSVTARYGGRFPLQIMALFDPREDAGFYVRTEDREAVMRDYALERNRTGTDLHVRYPPRNVPSGGRLAAVPTILGVGDGDWHTAFNAYTRWLHSWYRPLSPRKQWFREVFNFRQRFLHSHEPLYDRRTGTYRLRDAWKEANEHFGGMEYLHLFDWGNVDGVGRIYGLTGDQSPFEGTLRGGIEAFRAAIADIQGKGVKTGLYIEGYLLQERGRLGAAHGKEWQIVQRNGEPMYWPSSTEMMICSAVPAWRKVQASTYERYVRQLGVDGMYLDQFGFANGAKDCWATGHGHPVPGYTVRSERGLTRQVREAMENVRPGVALYTEETPCDVNSQLQDGSFTYHMNHVRRRNPIAPLNAVRFAIPSFKTFEILVCDRPMGSWSEGVEWIFFNGEGILLEGPATDWFATHTLRPIRRCHAILGKYRDAFTSDHPVPLVTTATPTVLANRFPGRNRTVLTLYNRAHRSVPARIPLSCFGGEAGAAERSYRNAWRDRELRPVSIDGEPCLLVPLSARGVGCVVSTGT